MATFTVRELTELGELDKAKAEVRRLAEKGIVDMELRFGHELAHGDWCEHESFREARRCVRGMELAGMVTGRVRSLVQ